MLQFPHQCTSYATECAIDPRGNDSRRTQSSGKACHRAGNAVLQGDDARFIANSFKEGATFGCHDRFAIEPRGDPTTAQVARHSKVDSLARFRQSRAVRPGRPKQRDGFAGIGSSPSGEVEPCYEQSTPRYLHPSAGRLSRDCEPRVPDSWKSNFKRHLSQSVVAVSRHARNGQSQFPSDSIDPFESRHFNQIIRRYVVNHGSSQDLEVSDRHGNLIAHDRHAPRTERALRWDKNAGRRAVYGPFDNHPYNHERDQYLQDGAAASCSRKPTPDSPPRGAPYAAQTTPTSANISLGDGDTRPTLFSFNHKQPGDD